MAADYGRALEGDAARPAPAAELPAHLKRITANARERSPASCDDVSVE